MRWLGEKGMEEYHKKMKIVVFGRDEEKESKDRVKKENNLFDLYWEHTGVEVVKTTSQWFFFFPITTLFAFAKRWISFELPTLGRSSRSLLFKELEYHYCTLHLNRKHSLKTHTSNLCFSTSDTDTLVISNSVTSFKTWYVYIHMHVYVPLNSMCQKSAILMLKCLQKGSTMEYLKALLCCFISFRTITEERVNIFPLSHI